MEQPFEKNWRDVLFHFLGARPRFACDQWYLGEALSKRSLDECLGHGFVSVTEFVAGDSFLQIH
jgi:hypothetical protein